jgi:hypothetical protein
VKFGGFIDGVPKPKGKIPNPENFALEGLIWGMKNAMLLNILAPM